MRYIVRSDEYPFPGMIPDGFDEVEFEDDFDYSLDCEGMFPDSVECIVMGFNFNQPIARNILPRNLKELYLGTAFNIPIGGGVLPEGLHTLVFGHFHECEIGENVLPRTLRELVLGESFDREIRKGVLPRDLESLTFGYAFNKHISQGILPEGLVRLSFGGMFDRPIPPGILPKSLRYISFGRQFNNDISFNEGLKEISFGARFNRPVSFPSTLKTLWLGDGYKIPLNPSDIPKSLSCLYISNKKLEIPPELSSRDKLSIFVNCVLYVSQNNFIERYTPHEDLIFKWEIETGEKYLICSVKEDHVMNYEFMKTFSKTSDLRCIRCVYCTGEIERRVFRQVSK